MFSKAPERRGPEEAEEEAWGWFCENIDDPSGSWNFAFRRLAFIRALDRPGDDTALEVFCGFSPACVRIEPSGNR